MTTTFGFQDIFAHIDGLLSGFATAKNTAVSLALAPLVTLCLSIIWMLEGVKHWFGQGDEPLIAFFEKLFKQALILGAALGTWHATEYLISAFQDIPVALASAMAGTTDGPQTLNDTGVVLDGTLDQVLHIAATFFSQFSLSSVALGALVLAIGFITTLAAGAFIALSKISLGLLLGLSPLFVMALLFEWSKNYFASYLNQLVNFALMSILAVSANAFVLFMFQQSASKLAGISGVATIYQVSALLLTGAFGILVLWQVPSVAAGLAGGVSLSTFNLGRAGARGAWNAASNKRGRDNQRSAQDRIDIGRREKLILNRAAARDAAGRPQNS